VSDVLDLTEADLDRGLTLEQVGDLGARLDLGALVSELWPGYRFAAEPVSQDSTEAEEIKGTHANAA
jgi:hypothetical protein